MGFIWWQKTVLRFRSEKGMSLVGVLVAAGVGLLVMWALMGTMLSMYGSQKNLAKRFETLDLKQDFMTTFKDANLCICNLTPVPANLADVANFSFDASVWDDESTLADESHEIELPAIKTGCAAGAPNFLEADHHIVGSQTGLSIDKIKLKNLRPLDPGLPANQRLKWKGNWEVSFKSPPEGPALAPIRVRQHFEVFDSAGSPENARRISVCLASDSGAAGAGVPPAKVFKGTTSVTYFNGQPHSVFSPVIPFPPGCNNPKIFLEGKVDSLLCGNGVGPTICSAYVGGSSQDVTPYLANVTATGFQAFYSGMSGVWVGATSPAFPIDWMVACD